MMCSLSMEHISDYAGKSFQSLPKKALDGDFSQEREKAIQPNKLNWCCWGETPPCSPTPPFIRSWLMDETMKPHGFFGGVAYPVTSCHRFLPVRSKAWVWIYRWPGDVQDFLPMRSFSIRASRHQGIQRASSIDPNAYKYINYLKPSGNRKKKKHDIQHMTSFSNKQGLWDSMISCQRAQAIAFTVGASSTVGPHHRRSANNQSAFSSPKICPIETHHVFFQM